MLNVRTHPSGATQHPEGCCGPNGVSDCAHSTLRDAVWHPILSAARCHYLCATHLLIATLLLIAGCAASPATHAPPAPKSAPRLLVFSKTAGFRHDSIPPGIEAIERLGREHHIEVDATEDAGQFTIERLTRYAAVIFLNTTGDVLNDEQQVALQGYIRSGGGFVGIHAAADTEHDWPWYGQLVGATFASHPAVQKAAIDVVNADHPSTRPLPGRWERTDEWYNFAAAPDGKVAILMSLDERSYSGGSMNGNHPIAWCHEFEGGRAWYTGCGHTIESYSDPLFLAHLWGGISWAAGVAR